MASAVRSRGAALRSPGPATPQAQPVDVVAAGPGGHESAGDRGARAGERPHRIVGLGVRERGLSVPPADSAPPPIPLAATYAEAQDWLVNNPLYAQTTADACSLRGAADQCGDRRDAELESHFNGHVECLVRVWNPPVTGAGFLLPCRRSPSTARRSAPSAAGAGENAFYCRADQQIYLCNLLPAVPTVRTHKGRATGDGPRVRPRDPGSDRPPGHRRRPGSDTDSEAGVESADPAERDPGRLLGRDLHALGPSLGVQQSDLRCIEETFVPPATT